MASTITEAAKAVRSALKQAFPQSKFSVTSSSYINVVWTDDGRSSPSVEQVKAALLAAGCAEACTVWNDDCYLRTSGGNHFWFDRYSPIERAAEEQAREQRRAEWGAQQAQRRREAEEARAAARVPSTFWYSELIPSIPLLRELNDWVIKQNENRLPKWKFKFAPDLAVQIQTKVTRQHAILFECIAIRAENISAKHFTEPKQLRELDYGKHIFDLFCDDHEPDAAWHFQTRRATYGRDYSRDERMELRQQVIDALHPDRFAHLSPERMLSPSCICCGKPLTDPASMARWIGPECWGNGSVNIPRVFKLMIPR
jgi:hypothetical protein